MGIKEDLQNIYDVQKTLVRNKVARFAYTETAYNDNDADGVEEYDVNNEQNIPTADADILKVNDTVLSKGYRTQASSITRMLMNHFFGRISYNLNKVVDTVSSTLSYLKNSIGAKNGLAPLDRNAYVPLQHINPILYGSLLGRYWAQRNITTGSVSSVYYDDGLWVAGDATNKGLLYSTDGKNWTQSNITEGYFYFVAYSFGIWVAGGYENGLYYSTDGRTWTQSTSPISDLSFNTAFGYAGKWVAGSRENGLYYSTDGMTWTQTQTTVGGDGYYITSIYCYGGTWVAGTLSTGLLYSTAGGQVWKRSNAQQGTSDAVYCANGLWVAGCDNSILFSTDGQEWTISNIQNESASSFYYADGLWVAGGFGLYYSIDGMNWIQSNITSGSFNSVYYSNGIWVAGDGSSEGLYYSTDGGFWRQSNVISPVQINTVYCANNTWVAGSVSNGMYYSNINSLL